MATSLHYQLVVYALDGVTVAFKLCSVPGATWSGGSSLGYPFVIDPPSGDGQELDPLTGAIRTGQYTVTAADAAIAGSSPVSRIITSQLFDGNGRQKLLQVRAIVNVSTDGGSSWTPLIQGFLVQYRLTDAITWEFSIGDSRHIEDTRQVFDGTSTAFASRGCIFGGPIASAGAGWGVIPDRGGWIFKVRSITAAVAGQALAVVNYDFISGYIGINDPLTQKLQTALVIPGLTDQCPTNSAAQPFFSVSATLPDGTPAGRPGWPGITAVVNKFNRATGARTLLGQFTPGYPLSPGVGYGLSARYAVPYMMQAFNTASPCFSLIWPAGVTLPTVGDYHAISAFTTTASSASPVYLDMHPIDIAVGLYTDAGIAVNAASATSVKNALGQTLRVAMRIPETSTLGEFLEKRLYGPFGFSARTNTAGEREFFMTRLKTTAAPVATIGTADLQDASGIIFDNDAQTIVHALRFKSKTFWAYNPNTATDTGSRPLDSVSENQNEVYIFNADPALPAGYNTNEVEYEIPGVIHDVNGTNTNMNVYCQAIAQELFDRYGRGAPVCDALAVLRASDTGFQVGDEVYVDPAHFPNLNYRFGDNPSVGARIMQILRRTESPAGPLIKVIDAGSAQQPVTPAAVISIAANATSPRTTAQFTVTNAAAINAAATLAVAIQWATGASPPAAGVNGIAFTRYLAGACPVGAIDLPPVAPGSSVYVRARTETPGLTPSAWTAWSAVTLTAMPVPSGLTFSPLYQNAAQFNWTPANSTDYVDVFIWPVSPSATPSYAFVCTLGPGSTSCIVRGLLGPGQLYSGAVCHRDPSTGFDGAAISGTFTTNSTPLNVAPVPTGFEILPTTQDASLQQGVVLALFAADPVYDFEIQRAPDVAGSPGAWATIATVPGSTMIYIDSLPNDGVIRWYQVRHVLSGATPSAYLAAISAVPGGVAPVIIRPPTFTSPALLVTVTQISSASNVVTFSVTITDPLGTSGTCTVVPTVNGLPSLTDLFTGLAATTYTATLGLARNFQANLNLPGLSFGFVSFKASMVARYDGYGYYFFGSAAQDVSPVTMITIAPSTSLTTTTAPASALVSGPSSAASIKWLASTVALSNVSKANVIASGATISSGAPYFTISSLGVALAIGDTVYLGIVYYDSLGNQHGYTQVQATRFNTSGSRTTRWNASALFLPVADTNAQGYSVLNWAYAALGFRTATGAGTPDVHFCPLPVSQGATINNVRMGVNCSQTFSQVAMLLFRNAGSTSSTQLGTTQTQTGGGAGTLTISSLSELASAGNSYQIEAQTLYDSLHANIYGTDMIYVETDTSNPNVTTNL